MILLIIIYSFFFIGNALYLNKLQLKYIKNILNHPHSPPEIKKKAENILIHSHQKWLHKKVNQFAKNNKFSSEFKKELQESAKVGLLKAFRKYNASMPLYKYADKYLFYEFTISISEQMPMKYLNHYERYIKKVNTTYPTFMGHGSHEKAKKRNTQSPSLYFDNSDNVINIDQKREHIHSIVSEMTEFEQGLFYNRYCKDTLQIKNKVEKVYKLSNISHQTYTKYMKIIITKIKSSVTD